MKIRYPLIALSMLFGALAAADAQVSVGIAAPGVSIGINLPVYPQLVLIPGYPVYFAPRANSNYFFYDGLYWVYEGDEWYMSSWYNGPWQLVSPEYVPLFILRIPVRYYRYPPPYFRGWAFDAPPRWGDHWGGSWSQSHAGWDNWNRSSVPAAAPLPVYQRQYSGSKYPRAEQQLSLQSQNYRYQPQDAVVQQHYQAHVQRVQSAPAPSAPRKPAAVQASPRQATTAAQQAQPQAASVPREQRAHKAQAQDKGAEVQAPPRQARPPAQHPQQQQQPAAAPREQRALKEQGQDKGPQGKGAAQAPKQQQDKDGQKDEEHKK